MEVLLSERVTLAQVDGILRGELDIGLARPPFDTTVLNSRVVLREPLMAVVPAGPPAGELKRPLTPQDFEGQPVIGYHPEQSRYFHELSARFLANAHPRIEQRVHQVLTVCCSSPPNAASPSPRLRPPRSPSRASSSELVHGGGDTRSTPTPSVPSSCMRSGRGGQCHRSYAGCWT